ncbi:uncharacterized protein LOC134214377 [Armigeres subalbatus]|uniref:uncharacterized protein LOC134214377 n=1 Tax=Armigeres subalbatus TaxID=124917 RepID=UPI002ED2377D
MLRFISKREQFFTSLGEQYPELAIDGETWNFIKEYEEAFRSFYTATKLMQSQHQPFSEFYMLWLNGIQELTKLKNNRFVTPLTSASLNRLKKLKENQLFRAALYLDPRFNFLVSKILSTEEKEQSQEYLIRIWERLNALRSASSNETSPDISMNESSTSTADEMDDFITDMYGGTLMPTNSSKSLDNIRQQIKMLEIEPRQPHTYDVWNHWLARKASHPELLLWLWWYFRRLLTKHRLKERSAL